MGRAFTEDQISPALAQFAQECIAQFRELGLEAGGVSGAFQLILSDDPILDPAHRKSRHGRLYYRGAELAKAYWAFSDSPGVYLFFGGDRRACYVGKAEVALGARIGHHIGARGGDHMYQASAFPEAEYVIVIPFERAPFLAPAFESYLLKHYDFPRNVTLKSAGGEASV